MYAIVTINEIFFVFFFLKQRDRNFVFYRNYFLRNFHPIVISFRFGTFIKWIFSCISFFRSSQRSYECLKGIWSLIITKIYFENEGGSRKTLALE